MRLDKWRIRQRAGKWYIYLPGKRFEYAGRFDTFADAVAFLPTAQRWAKRGFQ